MKKLRKKRILIMIFIIVIMITIYFGYVLYKKDQNNDNPKILYDVKNVYENFIEEEEDKPEKKEVSKTNDNKQIDIQMSGWIPYWDFSKVLAKYRTNPSAYHSLSPTWYYVQADGTLGLKNTSRYSELISLCQQNNTQLIPTISNSNVDELSVILNNSDILNKHINTIVSEVETYGYDGIDIDYELIKAGDKEQFTSFIDLLSQKLHEKEKILTIAILWKNEFDIVIESQSESRAAQDWEAIGNVVDEFRIMAYDYTHSYEDAGPIAPINWIESILEYAVTKVDKEKLVLGLPLYAYEWNIDESNAKALVYTDVETVKANNQIITDILDDTYKEKQLIYEISDQKKEIWYQDAEVTQVRVDLAKSYGIYKFIFWRLGGEDTELFQE